MEKKELQDKLLESSQYITPKIPYRDDIAAILILLNSTL